MILLIGAAVQTQACLSSQKTLRKRQDVVLTAEPRDAAIWSSEEETWRGLGVGSATVTVDYTMTVADYDRSVWIGPPAGLGALGVGIAVSILAANSPKKPSPCSLGSVFCIH